MDRHPDICPGEAGNARLIKRSLEGTSSFGELRRSMSWRAWRTAAAIIAATNHRALVIAALALCACEPTLERRVIEYERQVNARNVERVLDLFADDATIQAKGMFTLNGKGALRGMAEWDSVLHTRLTFYDMVTEGDTVLANVIESNDWLAALDIQEILHPTTLVVFRGGLITRMESETDSVGSDAIRNRLDAVLEWALLERPQVVRTLISDTGFRYDAESASRWLHVLEEWRQAMTKSN